MYDTKSIDHKKEKSANPDSFTSIISVILTIPYNQWPI